MRLGKCLFAAITIIGTVCLFGCGDKTDSGDSQATAQPELSDEEQIQEVLTEIITRWHYGDKAALYDNEFEYVRDRMTFDDYLKTREMQLDADTVKGINVRSAKIYGKDSAIADVEILFEGPTGKISKAYDSYRLYWVDGRWIRPTLGVYSAHKQYEEIRHQAESAAAAESDDDE